MRVFTFYYYYSICIDSACCLHDMDGFQKSSHNVTWSDFFLISTTEKKLY